MADTYLSVAAGVISLLSLIVSGLHCACRRRNNNQTAPGMDFDFRFQRHREAAQQRVEPTTELSASEKITDCEPPTSQSPPLSR